MGEGFRIKTMRFRGALSRGLFLPLSDFSDLADKAEGNDVTELLSVWKWEVPEVAGAGNDTRKDYKPYGIPATDETRIQ